MYSLSFGGISISMYQARGRIVAKRLLRKIIRFLPDDYASSLQKTRKSPRSHPFLGRRNGRIRFPDCSPLGVKAGTDWHRVVVLIILARALEHLAERAHGR